METDVELQGSVKATTDANDGTRNGDALHEEETDVILVSEQQSLVAAPPEQLPTSEKHIYLTAKSKLHPVVDIQVPGYPSFSTLL
jgi:hypothetical protein